MGKLRVVELGFSPPRKNGGYDLLFYGLHEAVMIAYRYLLEL
jgi:hypothetical protein